MEWSIREGLTAYRQSLAFMEEKATDIAAGRAGEHILLLEHPPLYTAGTSAKAADLLEARFPVHETGRGGQFTYHGPGQRVAYVMLDLSARKQDVRAFVFALEAWIIATLDQFAIRGFTAPGRVGVWVQRPDKGVDKHGAPCEDKIAAIGIRLRKWVSFHGIALNVAPDLTHFDAIVPCGIRESRYSVTSLADLGRAVTMAEVDAALQRSFVAIFGA